MNIFMKNTSFTLSHFLLLTFMFFSFGTTVYAVDDYTVLAPLPGTTISGGNTTNLQTYLPGLFNFSIGLAAAMAFVVITIGGVTYMTSDAISGKSQGREWVTNALWGLLLVIGAYVILNTINPKILTFNLEIPRPEIAAPTLTAGAPALLPGQIAEHNATKIRLLNAGVQINNNGNYCLEGQTTGCTNLNGLPDNAVIDLINLKKACNCGVVVTGGTEGGHLTHGPGKSIVDLSPSSGLNAFLAATNPQASTPVGGSRPTVVNSLFGTFTYENTGDNGISTAPHWHVILK